GEGPPAQGDMSRGRLAVVIRVGDTVEGRSDRPETQRALELLKGDIDVLLGHAPVMVKVGQGRVAPREVPPGTCAQGGQWERARHGRRVSRHQEPGLEHLEAWPVGRALALARTSLAGLYGRLRGHASASGVSHLGGEKCAAPEE